MSRAERQGQPMAWFAAAALALAACGSSGTDETASTTTASAPPAAIDDASTTEATEQSGGADAQPTTTEAAEQPWVEIFPEVVLDPTEPGPRPLLSWSEVASADLYQLTVLDADGVPYWAWSGSETTVPLGGMENPDAIGAFVFEELTWMVVARDGDGAPVGMSRRGTLLP